MITLYGVHRSRALRCIWALEEMGLAYRLVPVMQAFRLADPAAPDAPFNTRSADFLALNPAGSIPVLEEDGVVLAESLAINLFLAQRHGGPIGAADPAEAARIAQWTLFAATEIEPRSHAILMNRVQLPPDQRSEAKVVDAIAALRRPFAVLEQVLAQGHPVGGRFTVADIALAETVRYAQPAPEAFEGAPHLKAWLAACQARPAYRTILARRDAEPAL
ncbi:glutathione S-transferase [Falsiroseomonas bella]|uniref:Glutathione S-transferase n=1 Tax=Falsiroseomonas bella TaxID=2184016 RepID=A0A317F4G9_9PROT|nr:glutathione S-transferase family protein [Falsiroseomonas bella]PWS34061.1 glutathione S-transferase [Falsiroseomonas bella]